MSARLSKGFTLIELMVTVGVVAILAAIAYPSFQGTLRSNRVVSATNEVAGLMSLARSEAIRNKRGGGVCGSTNGSSCDGSWNRGMLAWSDANGDGALAAGETVLRFVAVNPSIVSTGPAGATISFDGRGRRRGADVPRLTLQPDVCRAQALRRVITINASGQLGTVKETCS